jgi:hypothetical protein
MQSDPVPVDCSICVLPAACRLLVSGLRTPDSGP